MSTHCCDIEDDTHTMAFALCGGQHCFLPPEKKTRDAGPDAHMRVALHCRRPCEIGRHRHRSLHNGCMNSCSRLGRRLCLRQPSACTGGHQKSMLFALSSHCYSIKPTAPPRHPSGMGRCWQPDEPLRRRGARRPPRHSLIRAEVPPSNLLCSKRRRCSLLSARDASRGQQPNPRPTSDAPVFSFASAVVWHSSLPSVVPSSWHAWPLGSAFKASILSFSVSTGNADLTTPVA